MPTIYDSLLNDPLPQTIDYTASALNSNLYPDSNTVSVLPTIWAPRIYGKDLTAFEIASSGKLAISLYDIHTIDVNRSNYVNATNWKNSVISQSNYSLELTANASDLQIMMDSYSNNINIKAASNIAMSACNGDMTLFSASNTVMSNNAYALTAATNIVTNALAGDITTTAQVNVATTATTGDVTTTAGTDVTTTANNNIGFTATTGNFGITANGNFVSTIAGATSNVSQLGVSMATGYDGDAGTDIDLVSTGAVNISTVQESVTIVSNKNVDISSSNNFVVYSSNALSIYSALLF
jgi:hypothetical protein